jgi:regulator of sigma E protease
MSAPFGVIDLYRNFRFCGIRLVERAMNITLLQGLIFFTVFTGMILIHEFGHFLAARFFKVDVEEFGFGLPPRLMKLFHWKGTDFTLNWLPLGGFVRPKGENDPNVEGGLAASSPWVRLGVLFAGPIMNLLAGLLVNSILFAQMGVPDMTRVMLYEVTPNSPAAQAGLQANDFIVAVDGQQVTSDDQFRALIQSHLDQPMQITVKRGDKTLDVTATPLSSRSAQEGALGILPGPPMVPAKSFFQAIPYGSMYTYAQMRQIVSLPVMLIRNQLPAQDGRFIGLKGIYDLFGQAVSRDVQSRETPSPTTTTPASTEPTNFTLQIIATLTLTLGIFNLLPFPALDGGRIMFVLPEIILRKRVPPELENVVNAIGFALLIAFMIYINAMDFINPVKIILP